MTTRKSKAYKMVEELVQKLDDGEQWKDIRGEVSNDLFALVRLYENLKEDADNINFKLRMIALSTKEITQQLSDHDFS